jgi:2'-5' RNA ligase
METARLFVGCLLDLAATRRCVDAARALRPAVEAAGWRAAWVPPANLHVTLRFLGDTDVATAAAVGAALAPIARAHGPIKLAPRGLLALPSPDAPRVIALEITDGHEALAALAQAVDDACLELGFPRATHPFRGHVTLARVPSPDGALDALTPHLRGRLDASPAVVNEITLWRSDLTRLGAEHHALARHPLGARAHGTEGPRGPRGQDMST